MEEFVKYGIIFLFNMQGFIDEQLFDLNFYDDWEDECVFSGGIIECKDLFGRCNGKGILI